MTINDKSPQQTTRPARPFYNEAAAFILANLPNANAGQVHMLSHQIADGMERIKRITQQETENIGNG